MPTSVLSDLILENAVFTLLSERRLGPKLYGVFGDGRLEEYIPARYDDDNAICTEAGGSLNV